jgi:hypothetical protein
MAVPTELKVLLFTDQVDSTRQTTQRTTAEIRQVTRAHAEITAEAVRQADCATGFRGRLGRKLQATALDSAELSRL